MPNNGLSRYIRRPRLVQDPTAAIILGGAAFLLGSAFLYDAFEGRGKETPLVLRPFCWW